MIKDDLIMALKVISSSTDQDLRERSEQYINSVINNEDQVCGNVMTILSLYGDPTMNKLLTIILNKMLKTLTGLDEDKAQLLSKAIIATMPRNDNLSIKHFIDFFIEFNEKILDLTDEFVYGLIKETVFSFGANFNNPTQENWIEGFILKKFCKKLLSFKTRKYSLFSTLMTMYSDTLHSLKDLVIKPDTLEFSNNSQIYLKFIKTLEYLSHIYAETDFIDKIAQNFDQLIVLLFTNYVKVPQCIMDLVRAELKLFKNTYVIIILQSNILTNMIDRMAGLFFNGNTYTILQHMQENGNDLYYELLRFFVTILGDFLDSESVSLNYFSDMKHQKQLEDKVINSFGVFPMVIDQVMAIYINPEIQKVCNGEVDPLDQYFEIRSKDFNEHVMVCGLKYLSLLFDFYSLKNEDQIENFVNGLLNSLLVSVSNPNEFLSNIVNYSKLIFIQENLQRINRLHSLEGIVKEFLKYNQSQANFFVMNFLENYFEDDRIPVTLLYPGIQFSQMMMDGTDMCCAMIATNVIILICNTLNAIGKEKENIEFEKLVKRYLDITKIIANEKSEYLIRLLDILTELTCVIDINKHILNIILDFLTSLLTVDYTPENLAIVSKSSEIFGELFLCAKNYMLIQQIFDGVASVISIQAERYMQSQQDIYLDNILGLTLAYITKFEIVCDQIITEIFNNNKIDRFQQMVENFNKTIRVSFYNNLIHFVENMKFDQIYTGFILLGNVHAKLFFILNKNEFIYNFIQSNTTYYLNVISDNYKDTLSKKVHDKSCIDFLVPSNKTGNTVFLDEFLEIFISHFKYLFTNKDYDNLYSLFDILDFICMNFPFKNKFLYEFVFNFFDHINADNFVIEPVVKNHLFLSINRIITRIILTYPNCLLDNKKTNFHKIISYMKQIKYSGK